MGGVVITRLDSDQKNILKSQFRAGPFQAGKRTIENWVKIPIDDENEFEALIPFLRKIYALEVRMKSRKPSIRLQTFFRL